LNTCHASEVTRSSHYRSLALHGVFHFSPVNYTPPGCALAFGRASIYHRQLNEPGGQRKPEALVSPLASGYSLVGLVGHPLGRAKHVEEPCDAGIHQRNLRCNCVQPEGSQGQWRFEPDDPEACCV